MAISTGNYCSKASYRKLGYKRFNPELIPNPFLKPESKTKRKPIKEPLIPNPFKSGYKEPKRKKIKAKKSLLLPNPFSKK